MPRLFPTTAAIAILASVMSPLMALAQDPAGPPKQGERAQPRRIRLHVRNYVRYRVEKENDHEHYSQPGVVQYGRTFAAPSRLRYYDAQVYTYCEWDTPEPELKVGPMVTVGGGPFDLTGQTAFVTNSLSTITGNPNSPPVNTKPTSQKPLVFGGDSDDEDSDSTLLLGPELSIPVSSDLSSWEPTAWLPENTTLSLYGRARFGEMEMFGEDTTIELYGTGGGMGIPIWEPGDFRLDGTLSAGVGFLRTDLGDATGFDAGAGLQLSVPIVGQLYFLTSFSLTLFAAENVWGWGPYASFGLAMSW